MANFFRKPVLFFLLATVLVAQAGRDDDCNDKNRLIKKTTIKWNKKDDDSGKGKNLGAVPAVPVVPAVGVVDVNGGPFAGLIDDHGSAKSLKVKDFFHKLSLLMRAYASKEFTPELKGLLFKIINFTLDYVAQQKPGEIAKLNTFMQQTAKVTSEAAAKSTC